MAVDRAMASQFSEDGSNLAFIDTEGKLKIWDTSTSSLKQEFTPNLHLSQPYTCLHWIQISNAESPWRKRKRFNSGDVPHTNNLIALGTSKGSVLLYSPSEANLHSTIESDSSTVAINCLTWAPHVGLISCGESTVIRWNLKNGTVQSKWKTSKKRENVTCALIIPGRKQLVTGSYSIKLWNVENETLLSTFTGHTSDIIVLKYIPSTNSSDGYLISGAKGDRVLSCWNLNYTSSDKNAIAEFLMEDTVMNISTVVTKNGVMNMAAVVRSGVLHLYRQTLNGKCSKPLKPQSTIQIACDTKSALTFMQTKEVIAPIPILAAHLNEDCTILLGYGAQHIIVFESVSTSNIEKIACLIRIDPRKIITKEIMKSKVKTPVSNEVEYLTNNEVVPVKRKSGNDKFEVPMEQRLENLILNKPEGSGSEKNKENCAHLLIQGLHSKDKQILQSVFMEKRESVIQNTVNRLPVQVIADLFKELTTMLQGRTTSSRTAAVWLKYLVQYHASQLIAIPNLLEMVTPALGTIEGRLSILTPLSRLQGRLNLLVSQVASVHEPTEDDIENTILLYQDQDSSDSGDDDDVKLIETSESEDQWNENSSNISNDSDIEVIEMSS